MPEITLILTITVLTFGFVVFFGAPFVPTRGKWAKEALELADIKPSDTVVDLGSGSGIILKLVAQKGAQAIGYELNPILVLFSKIRLMQYKNRVQVKLANFWATDLPAKTTIVYVFAVERDAVRLEKYLTQQKIKNLRVITFGFSLPNHKSVRQTKAAKLYIIN